MKQAMDGSGLGKRIMEAALSLLAEGNPSEVTMRRIAERVRIGHATIYSYFPNKDQLIFSLVDAKLEEMTSGLREHLHGLVGNTDRLGKFSWFILRFYEHNPELASLLYMAMPLERWIASCQCDAAQEQARILIEIVKDGQAKGEFRQGISLSRFRDLYFGTIQRLVTVWLASGRRYDLTGLTEDFVDLAVGVLRPRPDEESDFCCPFLRAWQQSGPPARQ